MNCQSKMKDIGPLLGFRDKAAVTKDTVVEPSMARNPGKAPKRKRDEDLTLRELEAREAKKESKEKAKLTDEMKRNRARLIVGVDFGTTYSGVSYVSTATDQKVVRVFTKWIGGRKQNDILEKVPTRIAYASENDLDHDAWGYLKPGLKAYGWFKLLLDENTRPQDLDDPLLRQCAGRGLLQLPPGKTAQDVATDFLALLYSYIMDSLETLFGKSSVADTPIIFDFTVPATWSPKARDSTLNAAQDAGFESRSKDELYMIDEPEAAAIATIASFEDASQSPFKPGKGAIVLDMGGGTVDLVTYKIIKLDPLKVEEICVGSGAKCGGTTIDRALHELLGQRYGQAFTSTSSKKIGIGSKFMEEFESIKRDFEGIESGETYELHLKMPDLDRNDANIQGYDFDEDEIQLTGEEIATMFERVLTRTDGLVMDQFNSATAKKSSNSIKHLILVGGASSPPYVLAHYKKFCRVNLKEKVEVLRPPLAWSAVCRGASLRGLETAPIMSRNSRYHWGIKCHKEFDEEKNKNDPYFDCPKYGRRAKDQMLWHIAKGEKIKPNTKKSIRCYYDIPHSTSAQDCIIREPLYYSNADEPPVRLRDESVGSAGILTIDISSVLRKERKKKTWNGDEDSDGATGSIELEIEFVMTMGSDKGILLATAKHNRTQVGLIEIQYNSVPTMGSHCRI